jgi:hypothetical protein
MNGTACDFFPFPCAAGEGAEGGRGRFSASILKTDKLQQLSDSPAAEQSGITTPAHHDSAHSDTGCAMM